MKNRYKFTLIELLIVVAIIGILTSILMPSLSSAREKGKRAVCMSNQRNNMLAFKIYAGDNRDKYPSALPAGRWAFGFYRSANFTDKDKKSRY